MKLLQSIKNYFSKSTVSVSSKNGLRPFQTRGNRENTDLIPSFNLAFYLENNVSIFANIVQVLGQEVFRRGFAWKPVFICKCLECKTEYQEKRTVCDCGNTVLIPPDKSQLKRFTNLEGKSFLEKANANGMSLKEILREDFRHITIADNGYILCIKNYVFDNIGEILSSIPVEFLAVDPREIKLIQQRDGTPGGKTWICLEHRNDIQGQDGLCLKCQRRLYEAHYESTGIAEKKKYYLKSEVLMRMLSQPSIWGGYPRILKILYDAYAYFYLERRTFDYYKEGVGQGILAFPTNNAESLDTLWKALLLQWRTDPDYVPAIAFDPGQGKGVAQFIRLMDDPSPAQIEVKKDLRERIGAMFGVSLIFQGDTSTSGGLNNEGLQITVTNRATESGQQIYNGDPETNYKDGILAWIVGQCGITDFVLQLNPSEEQDEMAEKQRFSQDITNAKGMFDMGFDIKYENDKFTFSGQAKRQEPMFGGAPFQSQPQPQTQSQEVPRLVGEPINLHRMRKESDEFDEYNNDQLIKSFAGDALQAIKMGALYQFYADVPESAVSVIHDIIKQAFLEKRLSLREMILKIVDQTGLDEEKARMIARTESSSIAMKSREIGWRRLEQEQSKTFLYRNSTKFDHRTSSVSKRINKKVKFEGGAVTLDRLKEIYKEESTKPYIKGDPDNSGMGASWTGWENFVGHVNERCTIVRVV